MMLKFASVTNRPAAEWWTLLTLCIGVLIAQLDTSVVNLGVRPIGAYFHASVRALQWVVDSYNLVYAVLLLTGGLLADRYGRRRIFIAGAAVFSVASLICSLSPSISVLIAGRALAGVGAALLVPASLAIIRVVWPDERKRARALGIWAACNGLAFVVGPVLAGALINAFGWPSIFLVVVPVGLTAVTLAVFSIPESSDPAGRHLDGAAQMLSVIALGGLALSGIELQNSIRVAGGAFAAAVVTLLLFIRVEAQKGAHALVPVHLFGIPQFRGAMTATAGMTFGMYGVLFLLPLTWQSTGRLNATQSGLALVPMALVFLVVSAASGPLREMLGSRRITSGGVALIGAGLLFIAVTAHMPSIVPSEIGLVLTGLGMGLATGPLMAAAVGSVEGERAGTAAALINVARMVGATMGVAALGAAFAIAKGGADGLRFALSAGGAVQVACATFAWITLGIRAKRDSSP